MTGKLLFETPSTDFEAWGSLQERARRQIWAAYGDPNVRCLAATSPTGSGKTRLGGNVIQNVIAKGYSWEWLTHRKTLASQTAVSFRKQGIDFGMRSSSMADQMDVNKPGQITMFQSDRAAIKAGKREPHKAKFAIVDEAHANANGYAKTVTERHLEEGNYVLLLTATPVGLGHLAHKLITLATPSELRKIGVLLRADCYAPSEVDMTDVRRVASGEFSPQQQAPRFMRQQVVGSVTRHYRTLNPHCVPTLAFAPSVLSSMWFTDECIAAGIPAAHIDGSDVYLGEHNLDGSPLIYRSSQKMREQVFDMLRSGDIKILWNRFVMREGVDIPEIGHLIFACSIGTAETWIQACGRGLRAHPSLDRLIIQDHGGNVHRPGLGSPNADREWTLKNTNKSIAKEARQREKKQEAPSVRCPKCFLEISRAKWTQAGSCCPYCGAKFKRPSRTVIQTDGTLKEVKERNPRRKAFDDPQKWWTDKLKSFTTAGRNYAQLARHCHDTTGRWPEKLGVHPICEYGQVHMKLADLFPEFDFSRHNRMNAKSE